MPSLKMYIGKILIASEELCYEGLHSCEEKENLHSKIVDHLNRRHLYKIAKAKVMPVFYIEGVESKMNYMELVEELL